MKISVELDLPINKVVDLFADQNNFRYWKKDFIRYEPVSGLSGEVGAVTRLIGKRGIMLETIVSKNLPSEIIQTYDHMRGEKTMMSHRAINRFVSLTPNKTLYELDSEVTQVKNFLMRLMLKLMAGAGKKYAQGQLDQFKAFAEGGTGGK
jgi:hypothetical protein